MRTEKEIGEEASRGMYDLGHKVFECLCIVKKLFDLESECTRVKQENEGKPQNETDSD